MVRGGPGAPIAKVELKAALVSLHPYEVPELIVLPIEDGHAPYLAWLDESVAGPTRE